MLFLWFYWKATVPHGGFSYYEFVIGVAICPELVVNYGHLGNIAFFGRAFGQKGVSGHIKYPRTVMLERTAVSVLCFAALFATCAFFTLSRFLLGGALGCAALGLRLLFLNRKARREVLASEAFRAYFEQEPE